MGWLFRICDEFSTDMIPISLIWSKPFDSKHLAIVNFLCFWKSLLMPGLTVSKKCLASAGIFLESLTCLSQQ